MTDPGRYTSTGLVRRLAGAAAFLAILAPGPGRTQPPQPEDWPCIQVLVPRISAGVVWDGPSVEGIDGAWRQAPEVAALVPRLTSRRTSIDEAKGLVASFAGTLDSTEREQQLTLLFAGVLDTLNGERARMISGIRRFTRNQSARARRVEAQLNELDALRAAPETPESAARQAEIRNTLAWDQRIFDDRERSIQHLCERPVALEERLGELARAISAELP